MAFLRSTNSVVDDLTVYGKQVYLRLPLNSDYAEWARLRAQSRNFLCRWEPTWPNDELNKHVYKKRVRAYHKEASEGRSFCFLIFERESEKLVGGLTLVNVRYGVVQSCTLGYWVGEPHSRHGYMSDAVDTISHFVFGNLNLHRMEAACLLNNEASIGLLEKSGFEREGTAKQYLKINGKWQDHLLFAKLSPFDNVLDRQKIK